MRLSSPDISGLTPIGASQQVALLCVYMSCLAPNWISASFRAITPPAVGRSHRGGVLGAGA